MIRTILFSLFICVIFTRCGNNKTEAQPEVVNRDYTINKQTAFSEMQLDSTRLESFITNRKLSEEDADLMRSFYNSRNYYFAWFNDDGPDDQAQSFWNLYTSYDGAGNANRSEDAQLQNRMRAILDGEADTLQADELVDVELGLTSRFFDYARYAYEGTVDPSDLKWYIPRKKVDPIKLLDTLVNSSGNEPRSWEPINEDYRKLKAQLNRYYNIEKNGGWPTIDLDDEALRVGDSSAAAWPLQQRLMSTGEFEQSAAQTQIYTPQLEQAVRKVQQRFGLKVDGVFGPATAAVLNVPVQDRIKQMLVNMERMKWMPLQKGGTRLVANIPDFKLHVYNNEREVFNMKIVVGKQGHNTVVFSDKLQHVVFSPYWNVPQSIVRSEILPMMRSNANYLARNNMEQTGTRNGYPVIRQLPGGDNSLGRVKFIFPNSYAIYFHDTPAKQLFNRTDRAFSHGCIRLEQPTRLAEYLLRDKEQWTTNRITEAMYSGTEKWVKLEESVPVYITYFTSWVDEAGQVQFRDDIYGHDERLKERMFDDE